MIYTTKELINSGENEYSIRCKIRDKVLFLLERGLYSTDSNQYTQSEVFVSKKYPLSIITGLTAFSLYGLTDYISDNIYLATEQHSFPIRKEGIIQSYQDSSFFEVGLVKMELDDGEIRIYDLERMLIELFRLKEKYPKDIFYEVLNNFRKRKDKIDFAKVSRYLNNFYNANNLLLKIKETI